MGVWYPKIPYSERNAVHCLIDFPNQVTLEDKNTWFSIFFQMPSSSYARLHSIWCNCKKEKQM